MILTDIASNLDPDDPRADKFRKHISEEDTYGEYHDEIDTTVYIVENVVRLSDPFPMTELRKVENGEPIKENFQWPLSYVFQRNGDFPLYTDE